MTLDNVGAMECVGREGKISDLVAHEHPPVATRRTEQDKAGKRLERQQGRLLLSLFPSLWRETIGLGPQ